MKVGLRNRIRTRAGIRCEYCHLAESNRVMFGFHVEHVIPRQHGGPNDESNLAYSCQSCNRHKGPNLAGIDPVGGIIVPLFHPRIQSWKDHFRKLGYRIEGITSIGRVTVKVLNMNSYVQLERRRESHR